MPETVPAQSPVAQKYDQELSQTLGDLPGMAVAGSYEVPGPAVTGGWPALSSSYTPASWAAQFITGLLDISYAQRSRSDLGAWLQAQESPDDLPGVPSSVADKILYISLLAPELFGGQPTPVEPTGQWARLAGERATQTVSGLLVQPDPSWSQMIATGWQPPDPEMTEEDVSGLLATTQPGGSSTAHFSCQVIVGTARWHPGYGTVAVTGWTVEG